MQRAAQRKQQYPSEEGDDPDEGEIDVVEDVAAPWIRARRICERARLTAFGELIEDNARAHQDEEDARDEICGPHCDGRRPGFFF